jgi:hypothetical protein
MFDMNPERADHLETNSRQYCGLTMLFFRVAKRSFSPEDRDSKFLRNTGIYLPNHMASQPRKNSVILTTVLTTNLAYFKPLKPSGNYKYQLV